MEILKLWLLGIVGTTMLIAVAESLMPSGAVKGVGKLTCGLLLLLVIIKPLQALSDVYLDIEVWQEGILEEKKEMEEYYNSQLKVIIEQELSTYIVDKAMEMGTVAKVVVVCEMEEEGIFRPVFVEMELDSLENQEYLVKKICEDLGMLETSIYVKEVTDEKITPHR